MRKYQLESFIRVNKLNSARRASALTRMKHRIEEKADPKLAGMLALVDEAQALQRKALVLVQARRHHNETFMHAEGARALDARLDKLLSLLHSTLVGFSEILRGEKARLAQKMREHLFPDGVGPITGRPFVEQHELVKIMIHDLRAGELGAAVGTLQLEGWIEELDLLNAAYGQHLTRPERVDPEAVREADHRAWLALVAVVAAVVALYPTFSEADRAGREFLLQPLVEQQEEAALLRARRRTGFDEGEVTEETDEPAVAEADVGDGSDEGSVDGAGDEADEDDVIAV